MTLDQAIAMVDALKPNLVPRKDKIRWLSEIDGQIYQDVLMQHERNSNDPVLPDIFPGYTESSEKDTELLVPAPHTDIYRFQLEAQIDLANAELSKYNNSAALLSNAIRAYSASYTRTHIPVMRVKHLKF